MSLWYNASFQFKPETQNAAGIVKKAAERNEIPVGVGEARVKVDRLSSDGTQYISISVQDPRYDRMHEFTKEVLEKTNGLCVSVHVNTWYLRGES